MPIYYFPVVTPSHDLLLATNKGVLKVDPNALQHHTVRLLPPPAPYGQTLALLSSYLYFDKSGNFWLVCGKEVVRIDREGNQQTFTSENGLPPGEINSILQDRENNIWFTNEQNGLAKLVSRQVEFFTQPARGFTMTDMSTRDNSDSVWFYDRFKKSLLLIRGKTKKIFRGLGTLPPADHILIAQKSYVITGKEIYALHFLPGQRYRMSLLFRDTTFIDGNACFDLKGDVILPSSHQLTVLADGKILCVPCPTWPTRQPWTSITGYGLLPGPMNCSFTGSGARRQSFPGLAVPIFPGIAERRESPLGCHRRRRALVGRHAGPWSVLSLF